MVGCEKGLIRRVFWMEGEGLRRAGALLSASRHPVPSSPHSRLHSPHAPMAHPHTCVAVEGHVVTGPVVGVGL